jgi:hypothetical protein
MTDEAIAFDRQLEPERFVHDARAVALRHAARIDIEVVADRLREPHAIGAVGVRDEFEAGLDAFPLAAEGAQPLAGERIGGGLRQVGEPQQRHRAEQHQEQVPAPREAAFAPARQCCFPLG